MDMVSLPHSPPAISRFLPTCRELGAPLGLSLAPPVSRGPLSPTPGQGPLPMMWVLVDGTPRLAQDPAEPGETLPAHCPHSGRLRRNSGMPPVLA